MEIRFKDQTKILSLSTTVDDVIETINALLGNQYYFEGLNVDGQLISESPEQYIVEHLSEIKGIEIVAVEAYKFVLSLLISSEEYVERAVKRLPEVIEAFKRDKVTAEVWTDFGDLLSGVQWLVSMANVVKESIIEVNDWDAVVTAREQLVEKLPALERAMEIQAATDLASIIEEDIVTYFKEVKRVVGEVFNEQYQRPTVQ